MIDYTAAAKTYDNTRQSSDEVIDRFHSRVVLDANTSVLDFGCGTGSYLHRIHARFGCRCHGVEPAEAMRSHAAAKSASLKIVEGDHLHIPFPAGAFDFAFMTDVIHHVPDLPAMFGELHRVLRAGCHLCIVTQSHAQIEARFYCRYFPSLADIDKRRYPSIGEIVAAASSAGLAAEAIDELPLTSQSTVTEAFSRNVAERNYSVFQLLHEDEFAAGLRALQADLGRSFEAPGAGQTLVWLSKPAPDTEIRLAAIKPAPIVRK